jgi:hypothetical protein
LIAALPSSAVTADLLDRTWKRKENMSSKSIRIRRRQRKKVGRKQEDEDGKD